MYSSLVYKPVNQGVRQGAHLNNHNNRLQYYPAMWEVVTQSGTATGTTGYPRLSIGEFSQPWVLLSLAVRDSMLQLQYRIEGKMRCHGHWRQRLDAHWTTALYIGAANHILPPLQFSGTQ
jgi:hypothetical protein